MNLPSKENICAVVTTYNPDHLLIEEINAVYDQVAAVIIVDNNSAEKKILEEVRSLHSTIQFIYNTSNEGIAAALNTGIESAIAKGFTWVLQLDQDSIPERFAVSELCRCCAIYNNENLAQAGCNYLMQDKPLFAEQNKPYREVLTLITSGSLLNVNAYRKAGGYRNDFFIDAVDFEYSLRLKKAGFHSIITAKPLLRHSIGSMRTVNFGLFKLRSTNHSAVRRYYRARNTVVISKHYFTSFPLWILKYIFFLFLSALLILILEKNKASKIKAILKGIKDGISTPSE
jgi:rhamnosyltransferase